jgi:enamine deaminase RidA (YjgF/YER057c/UK114 family)
MIQRYQKGPRMSQAVVHAGTVYIAGKVARNSKGSLQEQTRDVLEQIEALLAEAGSDKSKLLSIGIYLPNIADFEAMNAVYDAWVDKDNPPVRACVEARLANPDLRVEITAIAAA